VLRIYMGCRKLQYVHSSLEVRAYPSLFNCTVRGREIH
jgi:hypothetical protein